MDTASTIDFSNHSDRQLESALSLINRDKFENNYQACLVEINKRKAAGTWDVNIEKDKLLKIFKARKWVRFYSLVQVIGGVFGILSLLQFYGPHFFGELRMTAIIQFLVMLIVFLITVLVNWKYWKTENNTSLFKILLLLQIPAFQILGFTYEFYSGLQLPIGLIQHNFHFAAVLDSRLSLKWNPQITGFAFLINFAPIIVLGLLSVLQRQRQIEQNQKSSIIE